MSDIITIIITIALLAFVLSAYYGRKAVNLEKEFKDYKEATASGTLVMMRKCTHYEERINKVIRDNMAIRELATSHKERNEELLATCNRLTSKCNVYLQENSNVNLELKKKIIKLQDAEKSINYWMRECDLLKGQVKLANSKILKAK